MSLPSSVVVKCSLGDDLRRSTFNCPFTYEGLISLVSTSYSLSKGDHILLKYRDDEDDLVSITNDNELLDAIHLTSTSSNKILKLNITFVSPPPPTPSSSSSSSSSSSVTGVPIGRAAAGPVLPSFNATDRLSSSSSSSSSSSLSPVEWQRLLREFVSDSRVQPLLPQLVSVICESIVSTSENADFICQRILSVFPDALQSSSSFLQQLVPRLSPLYPRLDAVLKRVRAKLLHVDAGFVQSISMFVLPYITNALPHFVDQLPALLEQWKRATMVSDDDFLEDDSSLFPPWLLMGLPMPFPHLPPPPPPPQHHPQQSTASAPPPFHPFPPFVGAHHHHHHHHHHFMHHHHPYHHPHHGPPPFPFGCGVPSPSPSSPSPSPASSSDTSSRDNLHPGVTCDGCGISPLVGLRYKCAVCPNYDLCEKCESANIHPADHALIKLRPGMVGGGRSGNSWWRRRGAHAHGHNHHGSHYGLHGWHGPHHAFGWHGHGHGHGHGFRHGSLGSNMTGLSFKKVADVSLQDDSVVVPASTHIKSWRVQNDGTVVWPEGCKLIFVRGDRELLGGDLEEFAVSPASVGQEVEVSLVITAPAKAGKYAAFFRIADANRSPFGPRLWVQFTVADTVSVLSSASSVNATQGPVLEETSITTPTTVSSSSVSSDNASTDCETTPLVSASIPRKFQVQLTALSAMGFKNVELCTEMLEKADGNLQAVVNSLVEQMMP